MVKLRDWLTFGFLGALLAASTALATLYLQQPVWAALFIAAQLAISTILLLIFFRNVLRPLRELSTALSELRAESRDAHLPLLAPSSPASAEVAELARSIDTIASALREERAGDRERCQRLERVARSVIEALPQAIALISPTGMVEIANAAASRFGLQTGHPIHGTNHKWIPTLLEGVRRTGMRAEGASLRDTSDGLPGKDSLVQMFDGVRELFFMPQANPILGDTGELIGITLLLIDVSGQRQLDESRSGVLSAMSHQLKTPMTSIQMSVHLLLEDAVDRLTPRQMELLRAARDDADRLQQLIEELLTSARNQAALGGPSA